MMSPGLVSYSCSSSSDNDDDDELNENASKIKLPNPLREEVSASKSTENSDPSTHDGRVRTFAHERGIWATYVYIACPHSESIQILQRTLKRLIENDTNCVGVDIHASEELHMSLTRTVILRHHWIDEFVRSITNASKSFASVRLLLNKLKIYCNEEKTRTFLSLSLHENDAIAKYDLCQFVDRLDGCLNEFNLPPFYEDKSFHVSILWCLGDKKCILDAKIAEFQLELDQLLATEIDDFRLDVQRIRCQSGNKSFVIDLPSKT